MTMFPSLKTGHSTLTLAPASPACSAVSELWLGAGRAQRQDSLVLKYQSQVLLWKQNKGTNLTKLGRVFEMGLSQQKQNTWSS